MSKTARRREKRRLTILPWPERFIRLEVGPCRPSVRVIAPAKTRPDRPAARIVLAADSETLDQRPVARFVVLLDIIEKLTAQ
jgi:hypothetical protein